MLIQRLKNMLDWKAKPPHLCKNNPTFLKSSVVICWINWCKNECFWQRITCIDCIWWIFKSDSTTLICLSVFTHTLNCCVNVIIYASFGKMFQQTFFELFCTKFQVEQVKKERSVAGTPIPLRTTFTRKITVQSETMANTSPAWINHRWSRNLSKNCRLYLRKTL